MAEEIDIESNNNLANTVSVTPEVENTNQSTVSSPISNKFPDKFSNSLGTHVVNFEQDYNNLSPIDTTTFNDSINIALEGMPNLERNQPYFDMIDSVAIDMDKYPFQVSNNNMNSPVPGRAGTDYNPWETNTGEIDLSTANGRTAFLASSQQSTAKFKNILPTTPMGYEAPQEYSARRYNLDRYYRHPNFAELGFHPFANNEVYYQANSSKWDNFTRTRGAFTDMFDDAFTSHYRSIADMFSGDIAQSDMQGAMAMEDAMRIGSSTSGGTRGFFNDLFLNSAYTFGILGNIMVEEAIIAGATYLSAGSLAAPGLTRTVVNAERGTKAVNRFLNMGEWSSAGAKMLKKLGKLPELKAFAQGVRGGGQVLGSAMTGLFAPETLYQLNKIRQATKAGDNMTQLAKTSLTFGGMYRDFRMANLAWSESKMEGGMVEMQLRDNLYQTIYKSNQNNTPTNKQMEMIASDARQGAFVSQMINLPIIYLSNKIVLATALRGFRPLGRVIDDALDGPFGRIFRNKKAAKNQFYDIGEEWVVGENVRRMWKAGFKGSAKHMGATMLRYSAANFAEGLQELAQEATAEGTKAYFEGLYELDMAQELDLQLVEMTENYDAAKKTWYGKQTLSRDPAIDINEAISKGANSQMNEQGMKVFLSGFLMGGLVQVPQKFLMNTVPNIFRWSKSKIMKDNDWSDFVTEKEDTIKRVVDTWNEIGNNLENHFDPSKLNALTQKELNISMYQAASANDIASYFDSKDHSIFQHLYTAAASGKINVFKDMINDLKKADNKTLKEGENDNPSSADKIRKRLDNMLERADQIQNSYDTLKYEYVNPYDFKKYKKGSRKFQTEFLKQAAYEHARMMMMFTKNTFEQSLVRANSIVDTLASDPVLKSINAGDINILTNPISLFKEIGMLKEELEQAPPTIKKEKEIRKEKETKLEILERFYDLVSAEENQSHSSGLMFSDIGGFNEDGSIKYSKAKNIGSFDKRKINKLKPVFLEYLKFLAKKNEDFVIEEKINDTLKKIVDYGYLKGRSMDFYKAMNTLMNPEYLDTYVDRISKVMGETFKNYQEKNGELIKKHINKKIRVAWLEAIAVDGFQPDPTQTLLFLENGIIPSDYYDQEGQVTRQTDLTGYEKIQNHIDNVRKTQSVKEAEQTDSKIEKTESEILLDEKDGGLDITTKKGQKIYQDFLNKDKNTTEIINVKYKQYKLSWDATKGPFMKRDRWAMSDKGGLDIIKARYALTEFYLNQENIDKEKYPDMDSWLVDNERNILIIGSNGILTPYNVNISDILLNIATKPGIPNDRIDTNEKLLKQDKILGVNILETTIYDDDNQPSKFYEIVNNKKENVFEQYKDMDTTGLWKKKSFTGDRQGNKEVIKVYESLQKVLSDNLEIIPFAKETFTTGDIIQNKNEEQWMIKSTPTMFKNFGNLFIVPLNKLHLKKNNREGKTLTEQQFVIQEWEKVNENKNINIKKGLVTKVTRYQPLLIYPFNGARVPEGFLLYGKYPGYTLDAKGDALAADEFQNVLRGLTTKEREELTILVEVNPAYAAFKKDLDAGKITSETNPFKTFETYEPNPDLAFGQNKFEITIMSGEMPIGKMKGLTQTLLFDQNGKEIDGSKITAEQAANLFTITEKEDANNVAGTIRRNYVKAELITEEISKKLQGKNNAKIKISDLKNIEFTNSSGLNGWKVDSNGVPVSKGGKNASTAYSDLQFKTFDNEVIIFDTRRNFKTGRRTSILISELNPEDPKLILINNQINEQLEKDWGRGKGVKDLNMGRYVQFVKLPSGIISYFELKTDPTSVEGVKTIIIDIKNKQQEIIEENKKDGKWKPEVKEKFNPNAIVYEKNLKLNDSFYINTNRVGQNIDLFFDKRAQLGIKLEQIGKEDLYAFIDPEDLSEITDVNQFVNKINNTLILFASAAKDTTWTEKQLERIVKSDSFQPKLPMAIATPNDLIGVGVSARIIKTLKYNIYSSINYTNNDKIQDRLSNINLASNRGGIMTQTTPYGKKTGDTISLASKDLTKDDFSDMVENEFNEIPKDIIEGLRNKILNKEEIYPNEQLVIDAYKDKIGIDLMLVGKNSTADAAIQKNDEGLQAEADNQDILKKIKFKESELQNLTDSLAAEKKNELETSLKETSADPESNRRRQRSNKGTVRIEVEKYIDNLSETNEEFNKLEKELNKLKSQRGFKIVDGYDSRDVEHIKTFVDWAQQNLPDFIQIKDIEDLGRRLTKNGVTLGAFLNELAKTSAGIKNLTGTIYVGKQTGFRYHEAFHAVFRMMLSEVEIKQYLSLAKTDVLSKMKSNKGYEIVPGVFVKSMLEARDQLTRLSKMYALMDESTLNDRVFEEYLADEFEKFKINPRSTSIASIIKSFFNKIIEIIKHVFLQYKKNEIQDLFNSIDGGKFRTSSVQDNRFTNSSYTDSSILEQTGAVTMIAPKIRKGNPIGIFKPTIERNGTINPEGRIVYVNNYLSDNETASVVTEVSALYINKLKQLSNTKDFNGQYNPKVILDKVLDSYINERDPYKSETLETGEILSFYADKDNWNDFKDDLKALHNSLTTYRKDVIKDVNNYLNLFDLQIEDAQVELDRNSFSLSDSIKSDEEYESSANEIGGIKSLSKGIRLYLATRTKQVKDLYTKEMVSSPVNYVNSYTALMKALSGKTDPYEMIVKLKMFSNTSEDAKAVIDDLFTRFNLDQYTLDQLINGEYDIKQIKDATFFNAIIKGFQQLRSDYIQIEHDPSKGVVNFYKANNKDDASTQEDNWQETYSTKVKELNKNSKKRDAAQSAWQSIKYYAIKNEISEKELNKGSRSIAAKIQKTSGINLNWMTIKFLILNSGIINKSKDQNSFIKMFKPESSTIFEITDIEFIIGAIGEHGMTNDNKMTGNLFFDMNEQTNPADNDQSSTGTDVKFRIRKLAQLNSIFDPTVGATVFRNAEGKLIYAHQMPTYNLEKIAELDSKDALDEMLENPFLESNWLLNNPKFRSLAVSGKFRVSRVAGTRTTSLDITDENGYKANNKLNQQSGINFGSASGQEFIATLVNLYLTDFNSATGKMTERYYRDQNNRKIPYVTSLIDMTVISESKTADFVPLPVFAAVQLEKGNVIITDEYIETLENSLLKNEYQRIKREANQKVGYTEDTYDGYNDSSDGRAYKLYNSSKLLSKSKIKIIELKKLNQKGFGLSENEIPNVNELKENEKYTFFRTAVAIAKLNVNHGETVVTPIYTIKQGKNKLTTEKYAITFKGIQSYENYTLDQVIDMLKGDIKKGKANDTLKKSVIIGGETYHVRTNNQKDWLNGNADLNMIEIRPLTKAETEASRQIGEDVVVAEGGDVGTSVIKKLEDAANADESYNVAKARIEKEESMSFKDLIRQRLEEEYQQFRQILDNTDALNKIDKRVIEGLKTAKGKETGNDITNSMQLLNLKKGNSDYNLKQIFFNDYINRMSIKQILLKDPALLFKDAVEEIKRAKALNASGPNVSSILASPYIYNSFGEIVGGKGVNHPVKNISLVTIEDVETFAKYGKKNNDEKKVTESDAQLWYTTKAFRYMMFGLGSLTDAQAHILDRIEKGENISIQDFYGAGITKQGYKNLGGIINSKKFVYFDGTTFLKMSAFVLTKRLTSDPNTNFQTALPGRDDIHNMRLKLENIEETRPETIAIAAPVSASKAARKNVISNNRAFDNTIELSDSEITNLDARWMRLNQITPSNKGVITDPTQIKQLITSEQDDSVIVSIGGKEMTLGEVRSLYNKTLGDRVEIKFLNRRNLIFNFDTLQDQLQESIDLGSLTVDLQSFLRYAQRNLQASGSSPQLLELFETDKTGAQKYDLNNPITQGKFQQLFLAFLSKGVLNEKLPGESVALVSGVGMKIVKKVLELDENNQPKRWEIVRMDNWVKDRQEISSAGKNWSDLKNKIFTDLKVNDFYVDELKANVRDYDKDGNPLETVHSEFMLPAHFASLNNLKPGEPIPDAVAKAFGVRIPSQDKHSAINLKLVDFLPVEYGSSGVFPPDIIEISGADFDIDKLYIHFKEFYYDKDKGFVEYGKAEKVEEQYDEYLRYVIEQVEKSGTSYFMAAEKWSNSGSEIDPILDKDVSLPSEEILGALTQLDMPITLDEFKTYKKEFKRLPYEAVQNNLALDLKYAMLGNPGMTEARDGRKKDYGPAYEPAVLDPVEDAWNFLQNEFPKLAELVNEDNLILDNFVGMYRSWVNNKAGSNAIGAAVLPNIVLNVLKEYNIDLISKNAKGEKILGGNIRLNEIDYKSFKGDYTINPITKKPYVSGDRKQFILSALVTAATDNAKWRYLAKLGLKTKDALSKVVMMTGLGIDLQTSILLINQPEISNMYDQIVSDPSKSIKGLLKDELYGLKKKEPNVEINYEAIEVTSGILTNNIKSPEEVDNTERYAILKQFEQLVTLGDYVFNLQSLSTNTSFDYKDLAAFNRIQEKFDTIGVGFNNDEFYKSEIPFDARKLFDKNLTFQGRYYTIYKNIQQSIPAVFLSETPTFKKLTNTIMKNFSKYARNVRNKDQVQKDITSYLIGKSYLHLLNQTGRGKLTESLRNGFIYNEFAGNGITINSVLNTIQEYLKPTENRPKIENEFIDNFIFKKDSNNPVGKSGLNEAVSKYYTNLSGQQVTTLQNSIRDLYAIDDLKEEVIHLIHYLLLKDGLQFNNSGRTFLSLIPPALMEEMLVSSKTVTDLFNNESISNSQFEQVFGSTFQDMSSEFLIGYMSARKNQYYLPTINRKVQRLSQIRKYQESLPGNYMKKNSFPLDIIIDKKGSVTATFDPFNIPSEKNKKKGKFSKQQPNFLSKEGAIKNNVNRIIKGGLESDYVEMNTQKGLQRLQVLQFPIVISINVGSKDKPNYKTLRLKEVYTSKKMDDSSMVYDYNNDMYIASGWKAVYEDFETLGSMQQNPVSFIYGPRSTYNYLQNQIKERDAAINKAQEKTAEKVDKKSTVQKIVGTGFSTTATNDSVEYVYTDKNTVPLETSIAEKKINETPGDIPSGGISFAEFRKMANIQDGQYNILVSGYELLSRKQKAAISRPTTEGGLDISSTEELIEQYKEASEQSNMSEEDMLERMKKCYTK